MVSIDLELEDGDNGTENDAGVLSKSSVSFVENNWRESARGSDLPEALAAAAGFAERAWLFSFVFILVYGDEQSLSGCAREQEDQHCWSLCTSYTSSVIDRLLGIKQVVYTYKGNNHFLPLTQES